MKGVLFKHFYIAFQRGVSGLNGHGCITVLDIPTRLCVLDIAMRSKPTRIPIFSTVLNGLCFTSTIYPFPGWPANMLEM